MIIILKITITMVIIKELGFKIKLIIIAIIIIIIIINYYLDY
jgi:hypothetical protein